MQNTKFKICFSETASRPLRRTDSSELFRGRYRSGGKTTRESASEKRSETRSSSKSGSAEDEKREREKRVGEIEERLKLQNHESAKSGAHRRRGDAQHSTLSTQHSAFSSQHSALSTGSSKADIERTKRAQASTRSKRSMPRCNEPGVPLCEPNLSLNASVCHQLCPSRWRRQSAACWHTQSR
jgi:hypothetical protein